MLQTRAEWEKIALGLPVSFLQSWEWGEMQCAAGHPVLRLSVDGVVVTLIALELGFGRTVLFAPRWPMTGSSNTMLTPQLVQTLADSKLLRAFARDQRAIALRFEPAQPHVWSSPPQQISDVSPAVTSVLDLTSSVDELLAGMKQKTRYNVKLSQRQGVDVQFFTHTASPDWERLTEEWWQLVQETSQRHGIGHHQKNYYAQFIASLGAAGVLEVVQARLDGELLAMNLNVRYRATTTYVHGAATHRRKDIMASYALQWAAIQRAKAASSIWYDFYGIAPDDQPHHPLAGVTRFKQGFGGTSVTYPGTFELPLHRAWYTLYNVARKLKG